jgi:HEAT repeat protein
LATRQDDKALLKAALSGKTLQARVHGLWGVGQIARTQRNTRAPGTRVESLERLIPLLADAEPKVRAVAATVLGDARYGRSYEALVRLTRDTDPHTRALGTIALGKLGRRESIPAVFGLLADNADKDPYLRHAGVTALLGANDIDALVNNARHTNASVRMGILLAMRKLERNEIAAFLGDPSPAIVTEAARAINDQPIPGAMEALARLIERPGLAEAPLMRRVLNANYRFGTDGTAGSLAAYSAREEAPVALRVEALDALAQWPANSGRDRITGLWRPTAFARSEKVPGEALKPRVTALLASAPTPVRAAAARAAGSLKLAEASPALAALVIQGAADGAARSDALRSLSTLQTSDYAAALAAARDDKDEKVRRGAARGGPRRPTGRRKLDRSPRKGAGWRLVDRKAIGPGHGVLGQDAGRGGFAETLGGRGSGRNGRSGVGVGCHRSGRSTRVAQTAPGPIQGPVGCQRPHLTLEGLPGRWQRRGREEGLRRTGRGQLRPLPQGPG